VWKSYTFAVGAPNVVGTAGRTGDILPAIMALSPGTRLGPYEILSPAGAGAEGRGDLVRAEPRAGEREAWPGSISAKPAARGFRGDPPNPEVSGNLRECCPDESFGPASRGRESARIGIPDDTAGENHHDRQARNLALFFLAAAVMCLVGAAAVSAAPTMTRSASPASTTPIAARPILTPVCASNGFCMGHAASKRTIESARDAFRHESATRAVELRVPAPR